MSNPFLTPDENPVVLLQPLSIGSTTFTWGTGDSSNGEVVLSIDGGPQSLFSPMPGQLPTNRMPPPGNPNFLLPARTIKVGSQYLFKLFKKGDRTNPLAQVTVTAKSVTNAGVGVVGAGNLGYIQLIQKLKVTPGPDYVDFSFTTAQPTVPVIEVSTSMPGPGPAFDRNNDTISSAFPLAAGLVMEHQVRVGPGKKLAQGTTYFFIITAGTTTPGDGPTTATGHFTTGSRTAFVKFESIRVWRDGEPLGKGDMGFHFTAYDGQDNSFLANAPNYPDQDLADIGDGDYVPVNRDVFVQNAPAALTLECFGYDEDDDIFSGLGTTGLAPPGPGDIAPNGPSHGNDDVTTWATAQETYDLPTSDVVATPPPLDFSMRSDDGGVSFTVYGKITATNVLGVAFAIRRAELGQRMAVARDIGQAATVVTGPERLDLFTRGPNGAVYRKTIDRSVRRTTRSDWQNLGGMTAGPITALSVEEGGLHVFIPGPDGTVLYKCWDTGDGAPAPAAWHDLGGKIVGQITAIAATTGDIHLFALGASGEASHAILHGGAKKPRANWEKLGGKFSGPVAAVASPEGRIDIFAVRHGGGVYHKSWDGKSWTPAQLEWEELGGDFSGSLVAVPAEDGRFEVFAFVPGNTVYRKAWDGRQWEPSQGEWENIGAPAALLKAMMANGE